MNANKLAEIQAFKTEELTMWERNHTATMLRQQQAEIEALKQIIDANNLSQNIGQFVKLANEPVVWMRQDDDGEWIEVHAGKGTPFYTQPTQLSVETIEQIFFKLVDRDPWEHRGEEFYIEFANAILRKAQEK